MKIGEIIPADREITLNEGKNTVKILVANKGDRPVQAEDTHRTSSVQRQQEMYFRHPQTRPCHTRSIHWMSIWTC